MQKPKKNRRLLCPDCGHPLEVHTTTHSQDGQSVKITRYRKCPHCQQKVKSVEVIFHKHPYDVEWY